MDNISSRSLLPFFKYFIKPYRKYFVIMALLLTITAADRIVIPYFFKIIVDLIESFDGNKKDIFSVIGVYALIIVLLTIGVEACCRIKGIIEAFIIPKFQANIRSNLLNRIQKASLDYFRRESTGSIADKLNDIPESATETLMHIIEIFLPILVTVIISIAMLFTVDPYILMLFAIWLIVHLSITLYCSKKCMMYSREHAKNCNNLYGFIVDGFRNIYNIKLFAREAHEEKIFNKHQQHEIHSNHKNILYAEKVKIMLSLFTTLEYIAILYTAIKRWQYDAISLGDLVFIVNVTSNIMSLAWFLAIETPYMFEQMGICEQSLSLLDNISSANEKDSGAVNLIKCQGDIVYRNVCFAYDNKQPLFVNLNTVIAAKSKIGLVGATGSGKSTFVNLLLRIHDVSKGGITIDNHDIRSLSIKSLRDNIMMVPQHPIMFNRTIMENISYANPDASYEDIINACKGTECHDFIMNLDKDYNTCIGENGVKLSGGQAQLISIARAIIKNAPILLLDEITSSLDCLTESIIKKSIIKLMQNRTSITIAHRLSTLLHMDRILVFRNGIIEEDGTHEELLKMNGYYKHLWSKHTQDII